MKNFVHAPTQKNKAVSAVANVFTLDVSQANDFSISTNYDILQVETATVAGTITTSGNATVIVTAAGMAGTPKTISVPVLKEALQAVTVTVVGTITTEGNALVNVVAGEIDEEIEVAVAAEDTASAVAGKIQTALALNSTVNDFFTIGGTGADVVLTAKTAAANDLTMSITVGNDDCEGLTAATSTITTAGKVADNANAIAQKIRTALAADAAVIALYTVGGLTDKVILTRKVAADNDTSLNISIADGTCAGITTAASSTNTTAGGIAAKEIEFINVPTYSSNTVFLTSTQVAAFTYPTSNWLSTLTLEAGKMYLLKFDTYDSGTTWLASFLGGWTL